ncbi:DUF4168 domain-containing protein [Leptolyngbya sp. AN02str]|uniref:DUF4168 domain-containing protein n=1 Tax=Leptolyngbya sp. AN02str TaxID=3423363 RepID=UPI003D320F60
MIHLTSSVTKTAKRLALRLLMAGALSTAGVAVGLAPSLHASSISEAFSTSAVAQAVSDAQIQSYARSVLAIEDLRRTAYETIEGMLGSGRPMPNISCNQRDSLNSLSRQARRIAVDYCTNSIQVVERFNLSIEDFNRITAEQQRDRALADKIRTELVRLRQNR